jgi:hypothetical protein
MQPPSTSGNTTSSAQGASEPPAKRAKIQLDTKKEPTDRPEAKRSSIAPKPAGIKCASKAMCSTQTTIGSDPTSQVRNGLKLLSAKRPNKAIKPTVNVAPKDKTPAKVVSKAPLTLSQASVATESSPLDHSQTTYASQHSPSQTTCRYRRRRPFSCEAQGRSSTQDE